MPITIHGSLSLPSPEFISQLVNDTRFSSIREYVLDAETFKGTTEIAIGDIGASTLVYRIDVIVLGAFVDPSDIQGDLSIETVDDVLMQTAWNDPNVSGTYTTNCYGLVAKDGDPIYLRHNLGNCISGNMLVRLHVYNNITDYQRMLTYESEWYHTSDRVAVNIPL